MPFSFYIYKSTFSSRLGRTAKALKAAAVNAVVSFLYEDGGAIERKFGVRDWVVVL